MIVKLASLGTNSITTVKQEAKMSSSSPDTPERKWSCREKLAIASYVLKSGELHWTNVGRLLKPFSEPGRPTDWFSSKHCAQQYSTMLEETEQPRKKRGERSESFEGQSEMLKEEALVKKLAQERIDELKRIMRVQKTKYRKLEEKIEQIKSGELDDQLEEMVAEIEKPLSPPIEPKPEVTEENTESDVTITPQENTLTEELLAIEDESAPVKEEPTNEIKPDIETTDAEQEEEEEEEEDLENVSESTNCNNDQIEVETMDEESSKESSQEIAKEEEKVDEEDVNVIIEDKETVDEPPVKTEAEDLVVDVKTVDKEEPQSSNNSQESDNTDAVTISQSTDSKLSSQETEVENIPGDSNNDEVETKSVKSEEDVKEPEDEEVKNIRKSIDHHDDSLFVQSQSLPATPIPSNSYTSYESFPNSPALSYSSEMDHETTANYKAWRKSIMILWKQVASHRYASLFLQPVSDDIAPNYSNTIYRAMDLSTLKKNVENGMIRTTSEFQRDLMLMFQNALMYNNREHDVYKMANEMQHDVMDQVAQFLATQLMVEANNVGKPSGNKTLRRSTMRRSILNSGEKVGEARSKRVAAIEGEAKFKRKKASQSHE